VWGGDGGGKLERSRLHESGASQKYHAVNRKLGDGVKSSNTQIRKNKAGKRVMHGKKRASEPTDWK